MVDIIKEHITLIQNAIQKLDNLKNWLLLIEESKDNQRIKICVSDIDRCIETGIYYMNHNELFNPSTFSYDTMLVNLIDSIRDNDFGVSFSENQERVKQLICNELISLVEQLILINNKLRIV